MLSALAADRACVADLEAQIADLERSLGAAHLEKMLAQERLDAYKYPVLTLPNEIVSEIFIHFIPMYPICSPLTGLSSPTLLTQICRKWRNIARTTPALWRAISLSSRGRSPFQNPAHISDILSRSGHFPLSIEMCCRHSNDGDYESQVLQAAFLHRVRWEYVEICPWGFDLPAIERDLPLLRNVTLDSSEDWRASNIIIHNAPLLRSAVLRSVNFSTAVLPWAQLTTLILDGLDGDAWAPILRQASNLVDCELSLYDTAFNTGNPPPDVILPCLEWLSCDVLDIRHANPITGYDGFLNVIVVPALRHLYIEEIFLRPNPIDSLASFIAKSGCTLKKLAVTGQRSVPTSSYRKAFPSVGRFSFDGEADEDVLVVDSDSDSAP